MCGSVEICERMEYNNHIRSPVSKAAKSEMEEDALMEIRPAVYEDIPALLPLYRCLFCESAQLQPYNFRCADQAEDFLKQAIDGPDSTILAAVRDGEIAGFAVLFEQQTPPYNCLVPHRYAYLMDLIVQPELREIGIGSGLLDAAKDWARERKLDHLELNVLPENKTATHLYERNGFEPSLCRMQYRF